MADVYRHTFTAMGSPCEVQLYPPSGRKAGDLAERAVAEVARLEDKYTRYRDTSVTSQINHAAGTGRAVPVDAETRRLLDYAESLYQHSDGLFDITSGILRRAWDFRSARLPEPDELAPLLPLIGWHQVRHRDGAIELPLVGMELDFGGFVKEYAADCAAQLCFELGVRHGLVNLGGDVKLIGPHPGGEPWRVGIQHPRDRARPIASVSLSAGALTTSGDYERFMQIGDKRYCHLLDPRTGWSIQPALASVSVLAEQCVVSGALSTIAMLKSAGREDWIGAQGAPYLSVDRDMRLGGTLAAGG